MKAVIWRKKQQKAKAGDCVVVDLASHLIEETEGLICWNCGNSVNWRDIREQHKALMYLKDAVGKQGICI